MRQTKFITGNLLIINNIIIIGILDTKDPGFDNVRIMIDKIEISSSLIVYNQQNNNSLCYITLRAFYNKLNYDFVTRRRREKNMSIFILFLRTEGAKKCVFTSIFAPKARKFFGVLYSVI